MAAIETELNDTTTLAIAELPRDLAIIKMENDTMMSLATSRPRNHALMLQDLKTQLATYKAFCEKAMYAKPVGKDKKTGKMKFARGLSIRSAEAIAEVYGFNKVRYDVSPVDDNTARIEASFTDFQKGRVWQCSALMSKNYKDHYGATRRWSDDRFYDVQVPAKASKLIRECILRSVPPGLRVEMEVEVNKQLDSFLDENTMQKIVAQFSTKGVDQFQLEQHIGKRLENFNKDDRATLLGLWNAVDQGELTVVEVFGGEAGRGAPGPSRTDAVAKKVAPPPPPGPDPETQTTVNEQVERVRADHAQQARKSAEAIATLDERRAAAQVSPPLTKTQAAAEATAEELLPDEPQTSTVLAESDIVLGFCPIGELKNLKSGAVVATAGRIGKRTSTQVVRQGRASTKTVVHLYDGAATFKLTWEGQVPDWAHIDAQVEVTKAEVTRFYKDSPVIHIRKWHPATEPQEVPAES